MNKNIGIAAAIVIILLIALFAFRGGDEVGEETGQQQDDQPELVSMTDGQNTVAVSDQDAGDSVTVSLVTLVNGGFVVIHEDDDGSPAGVIGNSELLIGAKEDVEVTLDRSSVSGETLYAMLHLDDNGDGEYSFPEADGPILDQDGETITVSFEINGGDGEEDEDQASDTSELSLDSDTEVSVSTGAVVVFDGNGFSPQTTTIKRGESVTFRNESALQNWPATTIHPTHTVYPGSDIKKCGTSEAGSIFDACRGLENGESYTFTFNEAGSWKYHDHLSPSKNGTINVE